jgi:MFS family permease
LKHPVNYALALALFFFTNLAAGRVVLSLYALDLGASAFAVGAILAMFYVFPVLLSWPVGILSDRFGARWLLLAAAAFGAIGLVIPYFFPSMPALYAASALGGLSLALYNVILQSLVGMLSAPAERTRAFANLSLVGSLANAVGPALTGYAMDHSGPALASLYLVVFPALAGVLLIVWGARLPAGRAQPGPRARILEALKQQGVWRMLTVSALVQLAMDLYQFFIPVYAHGIGLSNSAIGVALSAFALAMFAVRIVLPRMAARFTEAKVLEWSFYVAGVGYLLIPLTASAAALAAVSFIFGLGIGGSGPLTMVLMFSRSSEGRSGEALGLRLTTNNAMRAVGPALFGLLASGFGLAPVFVLVALVMAGGGLLSRPPGTDQNSLPR